MNIGDLKINLLINGASIDDELREEFGNIPHMDLILPDKVLVNLLDVKDSPYFLKRLGKKAVIVNGSDKIEVEIAPIPSLYKSFSSKGRKLSDIGNLYVKWLFIQIIEDYSIDEVLKTIESVYKDNLVEVVHLVYSEWSEDGGIRFLEPYIREIKRKIDTLLSVEITLPDENKWIDLTYAIGVDIVIYNDMDIEKLKYAASIFPNGAVMSYVIPVYDSVESIINKIDTLTDIGVIPLPLISRWLHPPVEEIKYILAFIYKAIKDKGINIGWIRNISIIPTPMDGRFFVNKGSNIIENFYRTRLGLKTLKGLSNLIRKLRVKEVRDSFESSGL
jgi:hypothetical protein